MPILSRYGPSTASASVGVGEEIGIVGTAATTVVAGIVGVVEGSALVGTLRVGAERVARIPGGDQLATLFSVTCALVRAIDPDGPRAAVGVPAVELCFVWTPPFDELSSARFASQRTLPMLVQMRAGVRPHVLGSPPRGCVPEAR